MPGASPHGRRKTVPEVQQFIDEKYPGKFRVLTFEGHRKPAHWQCCECGGCFTRRVSDVRRNGICPACGPKRGWSKTADAQDRAERAAEKAGYEALPIQPSGKGDRRVRYSFMCPKHGKFSVARLGAEARCPRCHKSVPPNHPDRLPKAARGKAAILYLIEVRDSVGYWVKVGISTNWDARKRNYAKDGVEVLREVRIFKTTLYTALCIEMELKRWMRRILGKRRCPHPKWSGWSESAQDPHRLFPAAFDRAVRLEKFRRRR